MIDPASRHLGQLDQAGLIQRADTHPELEYLFRHALIQDAAYTSLLRSDRRRLHRAVAEALEGLYPDRQAALAPVLAQHFHAAEAGARALHYYTLAGDQALQQHALPEAVALYTQALDLAAADPAAALPLYHARGQALERLGAFERARADHETALELARTCVDPRAEWQALLDLGLLWSERDYAQAGTYFQQAVTQAGALSDPAPLAHSLNRLGNWHLNHEQPDPALRYHRDALALFQNLGDQAGIATTLDLLGMTNALSGDVVQSVYYYEPAIVLFQDLDDRPMLISSLAILAIRGGNYEYDTVLPVPSSAAAMHQEGERAIRLAQQIGWRAGEAYAWFVLGYGLGPWGEYTSALQAAQRGLALAEEIGHRQWACAAHWTLGAIYYDLLAVPRARPHLEQAVALGQALDSPYWTRLAVALQADCSVLEQDLPQAARLLAGILSATTPTRMISERLTWLVQGKLALAQGDPAQALAIADRLIATAPNLTATAVIPRLWLLRGLALAALGREVDAVAVLNAALAVPPQPPLRWRIQRALGMVSRQLGHPSAARQAFAEARRTVQQLAANIPDPNVRTHFLVASQAPPANRAGALLL